ncbi:hypothetical protein [Streptomyces sp. NBC_00102]|uniref:hypothetical protein n=1 Tax=Streptomyces sp. NBC_00102 TaxID=2975652 RepID=UPI00224EC460|nr:hypothetical protein [Streptomyces sp. NBC_00102]MCX5396892.1 hypothetical protein [Streptomyces sp. NBC_00102]
MIIPPEDQDRTEDDTMKRYARGPAGRRITACAVSAAALVLATGCTVSGSSGGGGAGIQRQGAPSPAATGPGGLGAKALKTDSVPGATVTTPTGAQAPRPKDVQADKPCGPLARAVAGTALGAPKDTVVRRVTGEGLVTTVTLALYQDEEKATAAMTALSDAADACAHGFTLKVSGTEHQVTAAARELAPPGADQAMGFGITRRTGRSGTETTEKIAVMRRGSTIALFTTTADTAKGTAKAPTDLAVPPAVVDTQSVALA